jgi:hypothetical protein
MYPVTQQCDLRIVQVHEEPIDEDEIEGSVLEFQIHDIDAAIYGIVEMGCCPPILLDELLNEVNRNYVTSHLHKMRSIPSDARPQLQYIHPFQRWQLSEDVGPLRSIQDITIVD